jgi:predicted nucleic acid-binding protein
VTRIRPVVVDTSVAVKWFFEEPFSPQALGLLETFRNGTHRPLAPGLIYPEFANTVWKRITQGTVRPEDGAATISAFLSIPFEITPSSFLVADAFLLALEHQQTVYDALFLALSLQANAEFITADESLYQVTHSRLPQVRWLGHWRSASERNARQGSPSC